MARRKIYKSNIFRDTCRADDFVLLRGGVGVAFNRIRRVAKPL